MEIAACEANDPNTQEHLLMACREEPLRLFPDTRTTTPSNAWAMTKGVPYFLPHELPGKLSLSYCTEVSRTPTLPLKTFYSAETIAAWHGNDCALTLNHNQPESQLHSGLHQKKHDQQANRDNSPLLLCPCETPPEVPHPALGFDQKKDVDLLE
ncbi:hypothetical protein DUI87_16903 [Hirundo rustica rustica]|uniref:Uncharacterized protein n=1 Tax=Hirundo rustica rustica TaxID=333673 RepID=A0A3M0K7X7_HIRRU|nr:hypothetical protein DUI87_16903 [Hirundo rustica rustica]